MCVRGLPRRYKNDVNAVARPCPRKKKIASASSRLPRDYNFENAEASFLLVSCKLKLVVRRSITVLNYIYNSHVHFVCGPQKLTARAITSHSRRSRAVLRTRNAATMLIPRSPGREDRHRGASHSPRDALRDASRGGEGK